MAGSDGPAGTSAAGIPTPEPTAVRPMSVRSNVLWYAVPGALERLSAFLLLPIYTRVMDPEEFGLAVVAIAVGGMAGLVLAPGLETIYLRYLMASDQEGATTITAATHLVLVASALLVLLVFADPIASALMPGVPVWPFYVLAVTGTALGTLAAPVKAVYRAQHRADTVAVLDFTYVIVSTATILAGIFWFDWGAASLLAGPIAGAAILLPISGTTLARLLTSRWRREAFRPVAALILASVPMSLAGYATGVFDRILLNRLVSPAEAAVYAVGFAVGGLVLVLTTILHREWRPLIFTYASGGSTSNSELQGLWANSHSIFFIFASCLALAASDIIRFFVSDAYARSAEVVPWIAMFGALRISRMFLRSLCLVRGSARELVLESCVSIAAFLAAAWILMPSFGAVGAAWAVITSVGVGTLFLYTRTWNPFAIDAAMARSAVVLAGSVLLATAYPASAAGRLALLLLFVLMLGEVRKYWRFLGGLEPALPST